VQARVLGCLVEKERTTPAAYPLTLNGLLLACNQTTSRWPIVDYSSATVENALANLRADGLVRIVYSRSNRAERYRHVLDEAWDLEAPAMALLALLLLRGPQTGAELRARAARLADGGSAGPVGEGGEMGAVDEVLAGLAGRPEPLVALLERAPGQKEARWSHLLCGEPVTDVAESGTRASPTSADRLSALEDAVAVLRSEMDELRQALVGPPAPGAGAGPTPGE